MRASFAIPVVLLASLCAPATHRAQAQDAERAKPAPDKCVSVRDEAIYGAYGYDHHVHLHNGCDKTMKCKVTGSANPTGVEETLVAGEKRDVVLFRGSPAREVGASVKCDEVK